MTTEAHINRVRKLAEQARAWEDQVDPYSDEGMALIRKQLERHEHHGETCATPVVCHCATCGVVNARLRGALTSRGWDRSAVHHVRVEGFDFRGGCDPYLAVVKVEGEELHRAYADLSELLEEDVLSRIEDALRRRLC